MNSPAISTWIDKGGFKKFCSSSDYLGSIDPDVKSVLFKNYPEHGAVHRENPRLHDLVLVLDELLVRLPRHLQPSDLIGHLLTGHLQAVLVAEAAHRLDLDGAGGLVLPHRERLRPHQLEHPLPP